MEDKWYAEKGFSKRDLQLSQMPKGVYFVKLRSKQEQVVLKLQKM
jgi:hypothetical protein